MPTDASPYGMEMGEVLSRLSHELKNPIAASSLAIQIVLRDSALDGDRETLRQIEQQLRVCDWTLDVVLDVTRKAEGRLRLNRTRLAVLQTLRPVIEGCEIEFRRPVTVTPGAANIEANLDRARLRNLAGQLLRNALRYSEGAVTVTISPLSEAGCEISVTDEGPGFPLELLSGDLGPAPARTGGLGLGLVFCQMIAREHGGDLRLQNLNPGACASVLLPD